MSDGLDDLNRMVNNIGDAQQRARRSYHQALSAMGAHGAPAVDVVEFALRYRLEQVPAPMPGAIGNIFAPTVPEMAADVVAALRETGHLQ